MPQLRRPALGVTVAALIALIGHSAVVWEMAAVLGSLSVFVQAFGASVLPFPTLLLLLCVAGALRWQRLFPWGLLVAPWLLFEAVGALQNALQPDLTGLLPLASLVGGIGDLATVSALIWGAVVRRRR